MQSTTLDLDVRIRALEDLRTVDRLLAGIAGSLESLQRQLRGFAVLANNEHGYDLLRFDAQQAEIRLHDARQALGGALKDLGVGSENSDCRGEAVELSRWAWDQAEVTPESVERDALEQVDQNLDLARRIQREVRGLFDKIRGREPALAERVQPLFDWSGEDVAGLPWRLKHHSKLEVALLVLIGLAGFALAAL